MEKSMKIILIIVIAVLAVSGIAACVCCAGDSTQTSTSGTDSTNPYSSSGAATYMVGDVITVSGGMPFQFSVEDVKRGNEALSFLRSGNGYASDPDSGYEYIMCKIWVKNTDSEKLSLMSVDFKIYANSASAKPAFVYLPDGESYYLVNTELLPNGSSRGWTVWKVPINSNCKLACDSIIGKTYAYVQL